MAAGVYACYRVDLLPFDLITQLFRILTIETDQEKGMFLPSLSPVDLAIENQTVLCVWTHTQYICVCIHTHIANYFQRRV